VDGSYFRNLPELSASRNATKKCLQNSIEKKYKTRDIQEKTTELDKTKFFHKKILISRTSLITQAIAI
jgi:patatin-like phospholipase/acyl hydrolase